MSSVSPNSAIQIVSEKRQRPDEVPPASRRRSFALATADKASPDDARRDAGARWSRLSGEGALELVERDTVDVLARELRRAVEPNDAQQLADVGVRDAARAIHRLRERD